MNTKFGRRILTQSDYSMIKYGDDHRKWTNNSYLYFLVTMGDESGGLTALEWAYRKAACGQRDSGVCAIKKLRVGSFNNNNYLHIWSRKRFKCWFYVQFRNRRTYHLLWSPFKDIFIHWYWSIKLNLTEIKRVQYMPQWDKLSNILKQFDKIFLQLINFKMLIAGYFT